MAEVVSDIRRARDEELESIRKRRSLATLHEQFSSSDGHTSANHASIALMQQIQEVRRKDLEMVRDESSAMIKSMRESLSKGGCGIVADLDEFYLDQKKAKNDGRKNAAIVRDMLNEGGTGVVSDIDDFYLSQRKAKDEVRRKEDVVWQMLSKGGTGVVSDLDEFYMNQRKEKYEGRKKEGGVWGMLHNYKVLFGGIAAMKKAGANPSSSSAVLSSRVAAAPSAASTGAPSAVLASGSYALSALDYQTVDYRGFVFVVHPTHGLMLLHCTRKKKKGPHFQLPGGHIDDHEFEGAARMCTEAEALLLAAAKAGAARELYEETGMDIRGQLERLRPVTLRSGGHEAGELVCELKQRLYFFLEVNDGDFWTKDSASTATILRLRLKKPLGKAGSNLLLKLSVEHSGFTFEKEPQKSAELLKKHSGGKGSQALMMAISHDSVVNTSFASVRDVSKGSGKKPVAPAPSPSSTPDPTSRSISLKPALESSVGASVEGKVVVDLTEKYLNQEDDPGLELLPRPKRKKGIFSCLSCCS